MGIDEICPECGIGQDEREEFESAIHLQSIITRMRDDITDVQNTENMFSIIIQMFENTEKRLRDKHNEELDPDLQDAKQILINIIRGYFDGLKKWDRYLGTQDGILKSEGGTE